MKMKNVTFISAGAGSGKTYSLTEKIVELVKNGECKADEIILTTFTKVASAELKEKVRAALYKHHLYSEADKLDNAAIGTIHSISYQMVSRYWFLLGISADVRMIADEDREFYKSQSLSNLPSDKDLELFRKVRKTFNIKKVDEYYISHSDINFWQKDLSEIIDKINDFQLDEESLKQSKQDSLQLLDNVLGESSDLSSDYNKESIIEKAKTIIDTYLSQLNGKENKKYLSYIEALKNISDKEHSDIVDFKNLSKILTNSPSKKLLEATGNEISFFNGLLDKILSRSDLRELIKNYIDTVFSLSSKWITQYEEFKNQRRLLDFNDVQKYFLELLKKPNVVDEIRSRYKIALVDEFQDCSPLQVSLFVELSKLMDKSYWVGDIKQAIYNFRGTDTSVVKNIIEEVAQENEGNRLEKLRYCWRSAKNIVDLSNSVFVPVFDKLDESLVKLDLPDERNGNPEPLNRGLKHWHFKIESKELKYEALAKEILNLKERERFSFKDIAILCRKNFEVFELGAAFERLGIPYKLLSDGNVIGDNPILSFLKSMVAVAAYPGNNLSKSLIAYYTQPGFTAAHIISDRLRYLNSSEESDWLDEVEIIKKIKSLGKKIGNQSVSSAIETLVLELNIGDIIKSINPDIDDYNICQTFIKAAATYEEQCLNLNLGCSLLGFVDFLSSHGIQLDGKEDGVTISTYHKSKGLEWNSVVLCSLHEELIKMDYVFFGVKILRNENGAQISLMPSFLWQFVTDTIKDRIQNHDVWKQLKDDTIEEAKRLLYVGITRPRELLITTTVASSRKTYGTNWLDEITGIFMNAIDRNEEFIEWLGNRFEYSNIKYNQTEEERQNSKEIVILKGATNILSYKPQMVKPSQAAPSPYLEGVEKVGEFSKDRLIVKGPKDNDAILGNCIHHLMCVYSDDPSFKDDINKISFQYGVILTPEEFMTHVQSFFKWMEKEYGKPFSIKREIPFCYFNSDGQKISGEIDMLYHTEEGDVLVDYKTFSGKKDEIKDMKSKFYAGKYSGQIEIYKEAIEKAGRKVRDTLICYFNLGIIIRIKFNK